MVHTIYNARTLQPQELLARIRTKLSEGFFVVLPGFAKDQKMEFTLEAIKDVFGLEGEKMVEVHGKWLW